MLKPTLLESIKTNLVALEKDGWIRPFKDIMTFKFRASFISFYEDGMFYTSDALNRTAISPKAAYKYNVLEGNPTWS